MEGSDLESRVAQPKKGFFSKLAGGEYGLARTYWLYGVVVGLIYRILLLIPSLAVMLILTLAYLVYCVPLLMGIWRAADGYNGPKVWAVLARIVVIISLLGLIYLVAALII